MNAVPHEAASDSSLMPMAYQHYSIADNALQRLCRLGAIIEEKD